MFGGREKRMKSWASPPPARDGEIVLFNNGSEMKRLALGNFYEDGENQWKLLDGSNGRITLRRAA
jgi:hypothetical protein